MNSAENSPINKPHSDGYRLVDLLIEFTIAQLSDTATRIGTAEEFDKSTLDPRYADAVARWREALEKDLIKRHGATITRVFSTVAQDTFVAAMHRYAEKFSTPEELLRYLEKNASPLLLWPFNSIYTASAAGTSKQAAEESFFELLASPIFNTAMMLTMNAQMIAVEADQGNVEFFRKVGQSLSRKRNKWNPTPQIVLHYWLPAILWTKTVPAIAESLKRIAKQTVGSIPENLTDASVKKAIQRAKLS
jgi:hypothetical protein